MNRSDILEKKEFILECIEKLLPKFRICQLLNCKPQTLNNYLKKLNMVVNIINIIPKQNVKNILMI